MDDCHQDPSSSDSELEELSESTQDQSKFNYRNYRYLEPTHHNGHRLGVQISPCKFTGQHDVETCLAAAAVKLPGYLDHQISYLYSNNNIGNNRKIERVQLRVLLWNLELSSVGFIVLMKTYLADSSRDFNRKPAKYCVIHGIYWDQGLRVLADQFYISSDDLENFERLLIFIHIDGVVAAAEILKEQARLKEFL